jgi:NADH-quinone oxidoreductase subunit B
MALTAEVHSSDPEQDQAMLENYSVFFAKLEKLFDWGRGYSFWPLSYGCNCCPMEMMASGAARFDIARFGYEVFRAAPRQADVLVVAGPVSVKMKPAIERLWAQMPAPKWVLAMGNCACSGGPFKDGYSVLPGCDEFLKVDVYLPGCPPRPEALIHALLELKRKLADSHKAGGSHA